MENANRQDLIAALVLEAGRVIEDLTPAMAAVLPRGKTKREVRIMHVSRQLKTAQRLISTAAALNAIEQKNVEAHPCPTV